MGKVLIIKSNKEGFERYIFEKMSSGEVTVIADEILNSPYDRIRKRIHILKNIAKIGKGYFKQFDTIIVFDEFRFLLPLFLLKRHETKLILWLWNTASQLNQLKLVSFFSQVWTFDFDDARKHHFLLNTQFYFLPEYNNDENDEIVYFRGLDKGRYKAVSYIVENLKRLGYSYNIKIKRDISSPVDDIFDLLTDETISYESMIADIRKSKAILDINKPGQTGFTLRIMEALYYDKKIITNNRALATASFYDKRMIFIIGKDDITKLGAFLSGENDPYPSECKEYYSFRSWLDRFTSKAGVQ